MLRILWVIICIYGVELRAQELRLCVEDSNYSPYINRQNQGIFSDLIELAAAEVGVTVSYHHRPWRRCMGMVRQGELDAMMAASWKDTRGEGLRYPLTADGAPNPEYRIWLAVFAVFVHKDSLLHWDGGAFSGLKTGVSTTLGYVTADQLQALKAQASEWHSLETGLALVTKARLDGYVVEQHIGWRAARALGVADDLQQLETPFMLQPWYVAFSPKYYQGSTEKVEAFWRAIGRIRAQEELNMARKYGLSVAIFEP